MTLAPPDDRDPVEFLAEQFLESYRRGLNPDIGDYAALYPDLAGPIRELFPAVLAMEMLRDGGVTVGGAALGLNSPQQIGPYRLIREIGRGGMGVVYEARDERELRRVAVKVLARASSRQARMVSREVRLTQRLQCSGVVPLLDFGEQDGYHYLVMQLIRGADWEHLTWVLRRRFGRTHPSQSTIEGRAGEGRAGEGTVPDEGLRESGDLPTSRRPWIEANRIATRLLGPVTRVVADSELSHDYWQRVATMGLRVAETLEQAHAQRTWHRDIKPANLLVDRAGQIWVTDLGLGKMLDDETGTHSGRLVGTWRYLAPEQFAGQSDHRSDLYSLGVSLFELATLRPAYGEVRRSELLRRITQESFPAARQFEPHIPPVLDEVLQRATAREPAERFQTASEFATALRPLALPRLFEPSNSVEDDA